MKLPTLAVASIDAELRTVFADRLSNH